MGIIVGWAGFFAHRLLVVINMVGKKALPTLRNYKELLCQH